jgi:hypothetical protein
MKPTKKQLKEIQKIEKEVAKTCNVNDSIIDEITGISYPKKTTKVTINDNGIIVNKETGEPHFSKDSKLKKSRDVSISLVFGKKQPILSLKKQIELQGFKISEGFLIDSESIRNELHALNEAGILNSKQLLKCFKKLSNVICKKIIDSEIKEGEVAFHKKTFID